MLYRVWRQRGIAALLLPFSAIYFLVIRIRRELYRGYLLPSHRLPVPVVVVGNITVGGAGKTPLTLYLVQQLAASGHVPGIVSRGYGSRLQGEREVLLDSNAQDAGDEAILLKQRSGVPVFVGRHRGEAAAALLAAYPQCTVIVCDDGLQHYALQRDVEIAVIDRRGFMNGWLLPAGPLREPTARLKRVDACVRHEASVAITAEVPVFRMRLAGRRFALLGDATRSCDADDLRGLRLHACAGIGEPEKFFDHLRGLGLSFNSCAFDDHHEYSARDFQVHADAILTTEKDAVKCAGLTQIPIWVLPVDAIVEPDLAKFVMEKINGLTPA